MKDMKNKKILVIAIIVILIVVLIAGGAYAIWEWETTEDERTSVVFKVDNNFSCAADGGGNIDTSDISLMPTTCTDSEHAIKREIIVTPQVQSSDFYINIDMWLNINSIDSELSDSVNLKYALTTSENSCTEGRISYGTFKDKHTGDKANIMSDVFNSSVAEKYYLYIWLDEAETSVSTAGKSISLSLGGNCMGSEPNKPEAPVLDENGMIPVTISADGGVTTVDADDESWYDYDNKEWANAILVTNDSRSKYLGKNNVTVTESDILAYYVWIPRYKYKIWTTTVSSTGKEQSIDIVFENKEDEMTLGTTVGTYRTHPAFWWDDNNNGQVDSSEMLSGIWVGKFETSANTDSTCYTSNSTNNCLPSNVSPRIVPNVWSLRYQTVSNQFATSQKFSASGNIYGLSNTSTNAHMMKNTEWGAVAYLSHSQYGIAGEIRINNNLDFTTGCGAASVNGNYTTNCEIRYNASSTPQSTTGNITGIYDMSGGAYEYVMGVLADSSGKPRSGYSSSSNSGFNGLLGDNTSYSSGTNLPASKYYDLYKTEVSLNACNGGICYGHALSEVALWYSDYDYFVVSGLPWVARGCYSYSLTAAGAFCSNDYDGNAYYYFSWRSVLVIGFGA